jgi:hypothetical protein
MPALAVWPPANTGQRRGGTKLWSAVSGWTVLQVVTGIYFRADVPLHVTNHHRALYTNVRFFPHSQVDLGVATLVPATTVAAPVTTVWTSIVERLEAKTPDGADELMLSTGGDTLYEDLCVVLSFAFRATFDEDRDYLGRLVATGGRPAKSGARGPVVRRVLGAEVGVSPAEVDQAREFMRALLALHRPRYERAMRAMRRIVDACRRTQQDPTSAYTDMVAALEALSEGFEPSPLTWERLDSRKRKLLDPALKALSAADVDTMRAAILAAERAGSKNRFIEFVMGHAGPSYYRTAVDEAARAVRATQLRRALSRAYDIRSQNVHSQRELVREAWVMADGAHTVEPVGHGLMLTHEGLHHLCQHVVRSFVATGSTELNTSYAYRDHLPNVVHMMFAPEYFIGNADTMTPSSAQQRLDDFSRILIELLSGRSKGMPVDMRPALERAEQLLAAGQGSEGSRRCMLSIYLLWHHLMAPEHHRPNAQHWVEQATQELGPPSLEAFTVACLLGGRPDWTVDDWCELAEDRHLELHRRKPQPVHPRIDAALWVNVTDQLHQVGAFNEAVAAMGRAVETVPGHRDLLENEKRLIGGGNLDLDWHAFVLGPPPSQEPAETTSLSTTPSETAAP